MAAIRFGSLFSGVGGFDLGLERAGMECAWQCEIDPYRREVLAHHWPDVERFEDVRDCRAVGGESGAEHSRQSGREQPIRRDGRTLNRGAVDLICGGFPCQDLSVAGKRAGLAGARSGLFFEFARIVGEVCPTWVLIENVPGLLSSDNGRDFDVVLGTLEELGYALAWRVLDSRYFGVPQRRRRVYIVGHSRIECAAAVLFEPPSLRRDSEASREAWEGVAVPLGASTTSYGGYRGDLDHETYVADVAFALRKNGGGISQREDDNNLVAATVTSKWKKGSGGPAGSETGNLVIRTAQTSANGIGVSSDVHALDGSMVGVTIHGTDGTKRVASMTDTAGALRTKPPGSQENSSTTAAYDGAAVRRLTPTECERLQAFPDGWTFGSDGKRYAAMGDAVTVNVIQWIGERMMEVHNKWLTQ